MNEIKDIQKRHEMLRRRLERIEQILLRGKSISFKKLLASVQAAKKLTLPLIVLALASGCRAIEPFVH